MATSKKRSVATERIVYRFKIKLLDSKPTIWRRILVPGGTLDDLHEWIQTAMGWTNSHPHHFEIRRRRYGGQRPPRKFHYMYDFGDG